MMKRAVFVCAAIALAIAIGCGGKDKGGATTPTGGDPTTGGGDTGGDTGGGDQTAAGMPTGDATRGEKVFGDACATCHGDAGEGSKKTPAVAGAGALSKFADDKALFDYLKKEMPKDDPGSLSDQEYADSIAWMRSK